ncbi:MAG: VWA domain-containing protein [Myxococcales bacterium]|nr:VWA domain-containing protein [Myxococcales bacterium]
MRQRRVGRLGVAALSALVAAQESCGSKTGLYVPCTVEFVPDQPEIIFVVDRSGSMTEINAEGVTYWTALDRALRQTLPQLQGFARVGMAFFPVGSTPQTWCRAEPRPAIDVTENISTILARFPAGPEPAGGTPTFDGLAAAISEHRERRRTDSQRRRFVVLVTDGGAGCNEQHALDRCTCLLMDTEDACIRNPTIGRIACLDDERILSLLRQAQSEGIDTFVIGLVGMSFSPRNEMIYRRFLDEIAEAGGRGNPTSPRYLAATNTREIETALSRPIQEIATCFLARQNDRAIVGERLYHEGTSIERDSTERNGWNWTDASNTRIRLFGSACQRAVESNIRRWYTPAEGRCLPPE